MTTDFSAYCGGLWLAALRSMIEAAKILGHRDDKMKYSDILDQAVQAYNKLLWNGESHNPMWSTPNSLNA